MVFDNSAEATGDYILPQGSWNSFNTVADAVAGLNFKTPGLVVYIVSENEYYYWKNDIDGFIRQNIIMSGISGVVLLSGAGTAIVLNTNVETTTKFMLTVQDGGATPTGGIIYQSARAVGVSFTITSISGASDNGVQVYYQLYE